MENNALIIEGINKILEGNKQLKVEKSFMQDRIEELKQYLSNAKNNMSKEWQDGYDRLCEEKQNWIKERKLLQEERDHYMKLAQETADLKNELKKLKEENFLKEKKIEELICRIESLKTTNKVDNINNLQDTAKLELRISSLEDKVKELENKANTISPYDPNNPSPSNPNITYEGPNKDWNEITI